MAFLGVRADPGVREHQPSEHSSWLAWSMVGFMVCACPLVLPQVGAAAPRPLKVSSSRVVVLDFKGPTGRRVQSEVVRSVRSQGCAVIVPHRINHRALLGEAALEPAKAVASLASQLGAVALISGEVLHENGRWTVHLEVHRGDTGDLLGVFVEHAPTRAELDQIVHTLVLGELSRDLRGMR